MRIRKNFSSISDLEERAFCEGYMYAQREFADQISAEVLRERLDRDRDEYEREMEKRKKKRRGGHVMGAFGTAGMLTHGLAEVTSPVLTVTKDIMKDIADEKVKNGYEKTYYSLSNRGKWVNRGLGLGAAALTAGGIYRANKKANKNLTYEDWLAEKDSQNED